MLMKSADEIEMWWISKSISNFFIKKTGSGGSVNEELSKEFHKPVIKKLKRKSLCEN